MYFPPPLIPPHQGEGNLFRINCGPKTAIKRYFALVTLVLDTRVHCGIASAGRVKTKHHLLLASPDNEVAITPRKADPGSRLNGAVWEALVTRRTLPSLCLQTDPSSRPGMPRGDALCLRSGHPQDHLHHQRNRKSEPRDPEINQNARLVPDRRSGYKADLPGDPKL
jgi:hypothetical protein